MGFLLYILGELSKTERINEVYFYVRQRSPVI